MDPKRFAPQLLGLFVMAIDSLATVQVVAPGFDSSLLALRHQLQNESATVNLINDAVKQVQKSAATDRQNGSIARRSGLKPDPAYPTVVRNEANLYHAPILTNEFLMAFILTQKWVGFTIKATVTVGLIWVVLGNQDLDRLAERLSGMTVRSVFLAAVLFRQNVLASVRWFIVMHLFGRVFRIPWPRFYFEGLLFNQALPSTIGGDGVRMYRAVKAGLSVASGVNGVLLDRS